MSPIPPNPHLIARYSSDSSCSYYDTTCGTHRLAIMIIIISVGILVSTILSLLYVRSRASKNRKMQIAASQRRAIMRIKNQNHGWMSANEIDARYGAPPATQGGLAPPPYEPRMPERVARAEGWR